MNIAQDKDYNDKEPRGRGVKATTTTPALRRSTPGSKRKETQALQSFAWKKVLMRRDASGDQSHSAATVTQRHYAPGGGGGGFGGLGGGGFGGLGCSMGDFIPSAAARRRPEPAGCSTSR